MIWPLIFAILSPLLFGFMNIVDKYVVSHRVKRQKGFAVYAAWVGSLFGIVMLPFLDWSGIGFYNLIYPIVSGLLIGAYFFVYYYVMQMEDASHVVGLIYSYPIIVAILSYFILNERISLLGYLGLILTLAGVIMISVRLKKIRLRTGIWALIGMIIYTAIWEFLIKIITNHIPVWNGFAISSVMNGVIPALLLFNAGIRKDFFYELKNFKFAFLTEIFTIMGSITLYLAMAGLPATIVSSIAAIQPLSVLVYERIADKIFGKMSRDNLLLPKLGAIILIVIGVILLSWSIM